MRHLGGMLVALMVLAALYALAGYALNGGVVTR